MPQISLLNKQRSKQTQICLLYILITTSQCQHRRQCTVAKSAIYVFFFFCLKHWESCVCAAVELTAKQNIIVTLCPIESTKHSKSAKMYASQAQQKLTVSYFFI